MQGGIPVASLTSTYGPLKTAFSPDTGLSG